LAAAFFSGFFAAPDQQNHIVDTLRHVILPFGMEAGYYPPPWPLIWINSPITTEWLNRRTRRERPIAAFAPSLIVSDLTGVALED
jgi:hypothetical protein